MEDRKPLENESNQTPVEQKPEKKQHHRLRNFLIILSVIIVALILAIGYLGIYKIPVVSSVMGADKPKNLGIKTSEEALVSIKEKIPMKITGDYMDFESTDPTQLFAGSIPVDTSTTSEEITSWLQRFEGTDPIFSNTQVKKFEGGLEISTMLTKYLKTPIYVKVLVNQTSNKSVSLDIQKASLGRIPVPEGYLDQAGDWFEEKIAKIMAAIPGFSMEKYEIHEDSSTFKGTFPAQVKKSKQGFSALFGL
ncbi:MAG: hypothetical protein ABIH38_03760 [Patescibacteria group bacterium]